MPKKLFTITSKDFIQADEWLAKTFGEEKVQESISLSYEANMIPELMQLYGNYVFATTLGKVTSDIENAKTIIKESVSLIEESVTLDIQQNKINS